MKIFVYFPKIKDTKTTVNYKLLRQKTITGLDSDWISILYRFSESLRTKSGIVFNRLATETIF